MADLDKYGIPPGGNNGAYTVKWYEGNKLTLSWEELVASIALGGWPQSLWAEAAAVAGAESSRQPFIYNTYKKGHFGLFQISRSAWPDFFAPDGKGTGWASYEVNAKQGYVVYQKQGWGAWQAHSNGAYLANLPAAKLAVARVKQKGTDEKSLRSWYSDKAVKAIYDISKGDPDDGYPGSVAGAVGASASDAAGAVANATGLDQVGSFLSGAWSGLTNPSTWMRVGYGALGLVLIAGGLFLIVSRSQTVQQAAQTAMKVTPEGAALGAVKGG